MSDEEAVGWLVLDPREDSSCAACGQTQPLPPTDVTCVLPTCSVFDAIFDALGTVDNEPRPPEDVLRMLRILEVYCRRLTERSTTPCGPDILGILSNAAVRAFIDTFGHVDAEGGTLYAPQGRGGHPCQHLVIAHTILQREIGCVEAGTAVCATQPRSARLGAILTAFDKLQRRVQSSRYFPVFDDLYEAVQVRNYFYLCVASSTDVTAIETWLDYFENARALAQDLIARVESFHRVMQCPRDVEDIFPRPINVVPRTPPPSSKVCIDTPTRGPSAPCISPNDLLTRTPLHSIDRDLVVAQRPRLAEDGFRDPATQPAGLFNVRQCCFVNALVQSLFRVAAFRSSVLHFSGGPTGEAGHARIARRLQSLFGFMSLSECSAINPGPLLDAIADEHPSFSGGGQHDAQELAGALFESIVAAFDAREAAKENTPARAAWEQAVETMRRCVEFDVTLIHCSARHDGEEGRQESMSTLIPIYSSGWFRRPRHVDPAANSLCRPTAVHAALDDYFCAHVDAEGASILGSLKSIQTTPRMLLLYVASRTASADGRCVDYPEWISLEPFTSPSKERLVLKDRHYHLTREREELAAQKDDIMGMLKRPANYDHSKGVVSQLKGAVESISHRIEAVDDALQTMTDELVSGLAVPCVGKGDPSAYRLAAVVAHRRDGDGTIGHYWACGRDGDKWELLDDARTSEVTAEEVFSATMQSKVYCAVYEQQSASNLDAQVPSKLRALIESEDLRRRHIAGAC